MTMNEEKVRAVIDFCYESAHEIMSPPVGMRVSEQDMWSALYAIESKIEELTDDDLGKE